MTPKEKAKQLVDKYLSIDDDKDLFCDECGMSNEAAKQCAIIAVDEILSLCWNGNTVGMKYWNKVKQEIDAL